MSVHHKKERGKFNHFSTSFLEIVKICKKGQQRKERKQWQLDSAINFVHSYSCYISCHDTDKLKEDGSLTLPEDNDLSMEASFPRFLFMPSRTNTGIDVSPRMGSDSHYLLINNFT
ncbi:hypothetical protein Peur_007382 [Populus x canadensis]